MTSNRTRTYRPNCYKFIAKIPFLPQPANVHFILQARSLRGVVEPLSQWKKRKRKEKNGRKNNGEKKTYLATCMQAKALPIMMQTP
jgi:hypothetical protein